MKAENALASRTAFYSGSFDPPTLGHRDIIARGLQLFDRLVIGIGVHPSKAPLFSADERAAMLQEELSSLPGGERGTVIFFDRLTVTAAREHGASAILRGLRNAQDLAYEAEMAGMNRAMEPEIDTVFLLASPQVAPITATLVRQILALGGDVAPFVSPAVAAHCERKREALKS